MKHYHYVCLKPKFEVSTAALKHFPNALKGPVCGEGNEERSERNISLEIHIASKSVLSSIEIHHSCKSFDISLEIHHAWKRVDIFLEIHHAKGLVSLQKSIIPAKALISLQEFTTPVKVLSLQKLINLAKALEIHHS